MRLNIDRDLVKQLVSGQLPNKSRHLDELTHEPAIWSWDTGQWLSCFDSCQLTILWMSNIKDVHFPRHAWDTPPFLLIVSPTPPVQSVDAYVRTLSQSRDNQTKRGWPYSMSMGLCPCVGAPLQIVNEGKCRLDANRKLSPWKMTPSTSLTIPRKWTSCWIRKERTMFIPCSRSGKH